MIRKHIELYLSTIAVLIAFGGAGLSWWQLDSNKEHNRLSVRPLLVVTPYLEGQGGRNGIYLSNAGLGPAIIKNMKVTINGKTFEGLDRSRWNDVLQETGDHPLCYEKGWPVQDGAMKIGEEKPLLAATKANVPICNLAALVLLTKQKLTLELEYASLYGDTYVSIASAQINQDIP